MKRLFLITLIFAPLLLTAQNIEFKKVIDDNVRIKEYDFGGHDAFIRYQKVADEMVLRFEDLKVQLYDKEFDRKWGINLERLKGGTKDYNKFATAFDDDFIYIMQYNITIYRPGGNYVKSQLHKIDYEGNIVNSIDFHEIGKMEYVKEMLVIDNQLLIFWSRSPFADKSKGFASDFDIFNNITLLNSDLKQVGKTIELPHNIIDTEQTGYWKYDGIKDGNFVFRRFHSKNKKGKYTTLVSRDNIKWYEYIEVTPDLETQNYRNGNAAETEDYYAHLNAKCKYDTSLYHLQFDGHKEHVGDLPHSYPTDISKPTAALFLHKGETKSENLIDAIMRLVDLNFKHVNRIFIKRIIPDPINNTVNIVAQINLISPTSYLLTLNDELKINSIIEYWDVTKIGGRYKFGHSYSYNYYCHRYIKTWGDLQSNHKINALEYSAQFGVKSHVTILNYDDYQILILDSKQKKTCTVYKIVK